MTGCIDRKTGKVKIVREEQEDVAEIVRRLLNAARLVGKEHGRGQK